MTNTPAASLDSITQLQLIADFLLGHQNVKTILEFGSRYGEDTIELSKAYPQGKVFGFECNPNTLADCITNTSVYSNIHLTQKAVSDTDGYVSFFKIDQSNTKTTWADGNQGASSLFKASGKYPVEEYVQEKVTVESIKLKTFMANMSLQQIDLLWMDIQGAELMALKGLEEKISSVKIIHMEVEFFEIYSGQPLFEEINLFMTNAGFSFLGYSSYSEYSADAIFVNNRFITDPILKKCQSKYFASEKSRSGLTAKIGPKSLLTRIVNKTRRIIISAINLSIILALNTLRTLRGIDKTFPIYFPKKLNKRSWLLWKLSVLNPLLNLDINFRKQISSEVPIDIYIPLSYKDLPTLDKVVEGITRFVKHPVGSVYIVADDNKEIIEACTRLKLSYVNEVSVLGYNKEKIKYNCNNEDRSGWLFQQLLKLNSDSVVKNNNFLILDADTCFIRNQVFLHGDKTIFNMSEERHEPYHQVYKKILRVETKSPLSFVSHHMLFNKKHLKSLKNEIEIKHSKAWDEAILEETDYSNQSGFSEYELYGNYMDQNYPKLVKKEYWFNSNSFPVKKDSWTKSVSLHSYL